MGVLFSSLSAGEVMVTHEVRGEKAWEQKRSVAVAAGQTVAQFYATQHIGDYHHIPAGRALAVYVRSIGAMGPYIQISENTLLSNLEQHMEADRLYLRFGSQSQTAVGGPTNLIESENRADGTVLLRFSDGSTAVVEKVDAYDPQNGLNSITHIEANADGSLTIYMTNLPPVTTQSYTGPQGAQGIPGTPGVSPTVVSSVYDPQTGTMTITYSDGTVAQTGDLRGQDGVGVDFYVLNQDGSYTLNFTNGTSVTIPYTEIGDYIKSITDNGDGTITIEYSESGNQIIELTTISESVLNLLEGKPIPYVSFVQTINTGFGFDYTIVFGYRTTFATMSQNIAHGSDNSVAYYQTVDPPVILQDITNQTGAPTTFQPGQDVANAWSITVNGNNPIGWTIFGETAFWDPNA